MNPALRKVKLIEIAELNPKLGDSIESDALVSFLPMSAVTAETASTTTGEERHYRDVSQGYTPFFDQDLLVAKITPCFENGKIAQATLSHRVGFGSTEFHVIRPRNGMADARYLLHFLRQERVRRDGERKMTGSAGQRRVPEYFLASLEIPLRPLEEQRRIATILDRVESLRAARRASLAQLDILARAVFFDLFGDPRLNEKEWPRYRIGSVISEIHGGASLEPEDFVDSGFPILHKGAIKPNGGITLDLKKKTFATPEYAAANRKSQVDRRYLAVTLRDLVPTGPSIGLAADLRTGPFDEYLLAQGAYGLLLKPEMAVPEYLVYLSNMPTFRHILRKNSVGSTQIHIRTPIYLDIQIPLPPIGLQREFASQVAVIQQLKRTQHKSLVELDELFGSVQERAFSDAPH